MEPSYLHDEITLKTNNDEIINEVEQANLISSNCVSIGTQCDWKLEQANNKSFDLLPDTDRPDEELHALNSDTLITPDKNYPDTSMIIRSWPSDCHSSSPDLKILSPSTLSQQYACNIPSSLEEENYLLKLDYKARNKLKTKQRRLDPFYRSQERVRQRTVMRMKRQDPVFRATEREKGRYRMRIKRLDPEFRTQERERQRARMKAKRSDPEFREREREQQKNRLHIKRLDPTFKEKERAQEKIRLLMKRQSSSYFTNLQSDTIKICSGNENVSVVSEKILKDIYKSGDPSRELQNQQAMFPENFSPQLLSFKSRDSLIDSFNFKKHHILNFYNSNKEHLSDDEESDISTSASVTDVGDELIKKMPITSESDDDGVTKESSESSIIIKTNELPFRETQKQACSSHHIASPNKFVLSPNPKK